MPSPTLQSFLDAAEENFRCQKLEEAIKQAKMARNYIDQFLIAYHVHMASQDTINCVPDWYAVLSIQDSNADAETIKNAFKKRVLKVHPDKNSSAAADDAFMLVSEALDVLKEPSSRQEYDRIRGSSTRLWKQHECDDDDKIITIMRLLQNHLKGRSQLEIMRVVTVQTVLHKIKLHSMQTIILQQDQQIGALARGPQVTSGLLSILLVFQLQDHG